MLELVGLFLMIVAAMIITTAVVGAVGLILLIIGGRIFEADDFSDSDSDSSV